jgi:hypothetical protein
MTFHHVYGEKSTQEYVFSDCGVCNLVDRALDGYNTTVFAFGQTGSGKTFSITGPDDVDFSPKDSGRWGIVPRSLNYLFQRIAERSASGETYVVRASYLEIYNEQVQDLLNPTNTSLPVRWTSEKGFYVENLFVVQCEVLDDTMAVLEEGEFEQKPHSFRCEFRIEKSENRCNRFK